MRIHIYEIKSDKAIMRKFKAYGVRENLLRNNDLIILKVPHRGVTLQAEAKDILDYSLTYAQPDNFGKTELTYHWPIKKWKVVEGDTNWTEKLFKDFGWTE